MSDGDVRVFADALDEFGCAKRLRQLTFISCGFGVEGVRVLADLLSRGVFPALEYLDLERNPNISDVGVVAPAEALMKSTQTCLKTLGLENVEMGDEGISALASLASQGRLEHLKTLNISENEDLTEQGIITLARAIGVRGLPMLETFDMVKLGNMTAREIGAIAHGVFKWCPQVKETHLTESDFASDDSSEVVDGMLEAAGLAGKLKVVYGK